MRAGRRPPFRIEPVRTPCIDQSTNANRETTLNLELVVEPLRGSDLVADYLTGTGSARRFYTGAPDDPTAYREKAREIDGRFDGAARRRAVDLVRDPSAEVNERLERLVAEDGYFVTTGQQPGLFTGPLYTFYKALSAVALARELETLLGRPVVPLFWIASEDHDWDEVARTYVVDVANDLQEVSVTRSHRPGDRPLHRISVRDDLDRATGTLEKLLPETEFSDRYLDLVRKSYQPGSTLPDGYRNMLQELLEPFGVAFVEAHDPLAKEASLPTLVEELDRAGEHESRLRERADSLQTEGYHVQVPVLEGAVNLFLEGPEGRERIYRNGEQFRLRHSGARFDRAELVERVRSEPQVLSPNVLLRPVIESTLFPTLSYVAGPGETAYFAQLAPLFERHGIRMPVVAPRTSITIVEQKNRKVLEKFDLELQDLDRPFHELASEVAREEVPSDVRRALGEFRGAVGERSSALSDAARRIDPTLKGPIDGVRNAAFQALDEVEKKIVQAVKRQDRIALDQLEKAQVHLFPRALPQERVLNVLYYLVRYGEEFLPAVASRCSVDLPGAGT